jgi:hypothetical protein
MYLMKNLKVIHYWGKMVALEHSTPCSITLFELYLQTLAIEALFACDEESAIWHRKLKILLYAPSGFRTYLLSQQT